MNINPKYKISYLPKQNKDVYICCQCYKHLLDKNNIFKNTVGFYDNFQVVECPFCFTKWSFHASNEFYNFFLEIVKIGKNKHFLLSNKIIK